jgi:membrane dipeptidase
MTSDPNILLDAHLDIAWNMADFGRDFRHSAYQTRQREAESWVLKHQGNATVGLPEMLLGRVGLAFATLFAEPKVSLLGEAAVHSYSTPAEAEALARKQIDIYQRLADENANISLVRRQADLSAVLETWAEGQPMPAHKVGLVLLMEGADPIREPRAFEWWYERGLRIVGLAWSQTRYAGGTRAPGRLTKLGLELLEVMASFNAMLDLSHMAEEAFFEALDNYPGQVIASHSNPRHFCDTDRHLSDAMIRRLAEHNGVMGVVPYNNFLWPRGASQVAKNKTPLSRFIEVIDYVCQVVGSAQHVGIGTDLDGGFGLENIPTELDTIADLHLIGKALAQRGYSESDISLILRGNFLRALRAVLPS